MDDVKSAVLQKWKTDNWTIKEDNSHRTLITKPCIELAGVMKKIMEKKSLRSLSCAKLSRRLGMRQMRTSNALMELTFQWIKFSENNIKVKASYAASIQKKTGRVVRINIDSNNFYYLLANASSNEILRTLNKTYRKLEIKKLKVFNACEGCDLRDATLSGINLLRANLHGAYLHGANLSDANLSDANLSGANLSGTGFHEASLRYTNFTRADLSGATLTRADLSGANLSGADLSKTTLRYTNFSYANLRRVNFSYADLSGINLSGFDLRTTNLYKANLSEANLSGVDLRTTNFSKANLRTTNFSKANLSEANLSEANLSEANLSEANLSRATLKFAHLNNANLEGAKFCKTQMPSGEELNDDCEE